MYDYDSIWDSYNDGYIDDFDQNDLRSNAEIVAYWNDFVNNVNIKDPVYKWNCFNTISSINRYIEEIAEKLRSIRYSDAYDRNDWKTKSHEQKKNQSPERIAFSCLFLVRCALICRIGKDWDLNVLSEFFEDIGQDNFDQRLDWKSCITTAEAALCRAPLVRYNMYNDRAPRKYCARVLVEAGIPLQAFQGNNYVTSKVVTGLKNVCKLYFSTMNENAYEKTIKNFMESGDLENPQGQSFFLPGGIAGCRSFFSIGLEFIEHVVRGLDENKDTDIEILLKELGFENPSNGAIDYVFGTCSNKRNKKPLSIKRILHWEDEDYPTQVYIKCTPTHNFGETCHFELKIAGKSAFEWNYASNGVITEDSKNPPYQDHVFDSATLVKNGLVELGSEILGAVDCSNPIFFKRTADEGDYEWAPSTIFSASNFPICAIFPEGYIEEHRLDLTHVEASELTIENETISYQVYRFKNDTELNNAGLSFASTQLVLETPENNFAIDLIDSKGRKHRNPTLTTECPRAPLRFLNAIVLTSEDRCNWSRRPTMDNENLFYFAYYKLNTATRNDPGCGILVLPRGFNYKFLYNDDLKCYTGIELSYVDEDRAVKRIENVEVLIDGSLASPRAWQNIQHNSIIRCIVRNDRNEEIHMVVPSPAIGLSWFFNDVTNKSISAVNYKKTVKLNCVCDKESVNSFHIRYHLQLVDGDNVLLKFEDNVKLPHQENGGLLDLPPYLDKLFSATNSLSAKIRVSAEIMKGDDSTPYKIEDDEILEITRFDERDYSGLYFCVGILRQQVLERNTMPTFDQQQHDLWIKVPAISSSDGKLLKWNHLNRIHLINNNVGDTSNLNNFQKMLIGSDFEQAQKKLKNYFDNHCRNLDEETIEVIKNSFNLCVDYDIPICNLWALQATIQDDRIFVQIPNIYDFKHLLNENTPRCSFDWQLIRPDSLDYVKDENVRKWMKKYIIGFLFTDESVTETFVHSWEINLDGIPVFPDLDDDEDNIGEWKSIHNQNQFEEDMKRTHHSELELLLYFIVKNVVYGTDEHFNQLRTWALLCLKYLKIQNAKYVNEILYSIRSKLSFVYSEKIYRKGYDSIIWDEWNAGKFKAPEITIDETKEIDFFKQGQNDAKIKFRERFWLESLKHIFAKTKQEEFYFNLYGFKFPIVLRTCPRDSFLQDADKKITELDEKYSQYKIYYKQGWDKEGENEDVQYIVNTQYLEEAIESCADLQSASDIGECVHKWLKLWPLKVDSLNIGTSLKEQLKKLVPVPFLDLKTDCNSRNVRLMKYLEAIPCQLGSLLTKVDPGVISFRDCLRFLNKDEQVKFTKMMWIGFGDYRFALDVGESIFDKKEYEALKVQKTTWWPLITKALYENDEKKARGIYDIAATLDIRAYLLKADRCFRQGMRDISFLKTEYKQQKQRALKMGWDLNFTSKLKTNYFSGTKNIKEAIYAYKCAARLGNAAACYEYYRTIQSLKSTTDLANLFEMVFATHFLDEEDRLLVKHDKRVFDKWLGLDNEWVFLRKAYLMNYSKAVQEWNSVRDSYIRRIIDQRDGMEYTAIFADDRWWLAEDLKYNVPGVKILNEKYYYNFETATKAIIPGWRIPNRTDYKNLNRWCSKHSVQKSPAGTSLKSTEWGVNNSSKEVARGTDDFGFAAKPFGMMIDGHENVFRNDETFYWTSTGIDEANASCISLSSSDNELCITSMPKDFYLSIRLVCDYLPESELNIE